MKLKPMEFAALLVGELAALVAIMVFLPWQIGVIYAVFSLPVFVATFLLVRPSQAVPTPQVENVAKRIQPEVCAVEPAVPAVFTTLPVVTAPVACHDFAAPISLAQPPLPSVTPAPNGIAPGAILATVSWTGQKGILLQLPKTGTSAHAERLAGMAAYAAEHGHPRQVPSRHRRPGAPAGLHLVRGTGTG